MWRVSYSNPYRYQDTCPNVLLRCVDPRCHAPLEEVLSPWLLEKSGSRAFASMALPGGAKALLDPASQTVVMEALAFTVTRLQAHRLVIADHRDCRACGGSERWADAPAELAFHTEQLREARAVVQAEFPRLEIVLVYQDWETITEVEA
jgi:hypothetical protein